MNGELIRIEKMNNTFNAPVNKTLTDHGKDRLEAFKQVFSDELSELDEVYEIGQADFVKLADCFGDLLVYLLSECRRWGIPIKQVFHIIMDSQDSKLVNGKPLWNEEGTKFIKGPNYVAPESQITALLEHYK